MASGSRRLPDLSGLFDRIRRMAGDHPPEVVPYIIVGTGNPGPEYRNTRHNAGFWCIDRLAGRATVKPDRMHRHVLAAEAHLAGEPVVLAKPRTFVNRSGQAVEYLLTRYGVEPDRLIVIVDDIHLAPGTIRVRSKGSAGGHRGLKSIAEHLRTTDFVRVRIGVGEPDDPSEQVNHVLGTLPPDERKLVDEALERAADAVEAIITDGLTEAMNRYNRGPGQ